MISHVDIALIVTGAALLSLVATGAARPLLRRGGVVDESTERSAHRGTAVRGAGVGPAAALVGALVALAAFHSVPGPGLVLVALSALAYGGLGLWDDIRRLPVRVRLPAQAVIATTVMAVAVAASWIPWWLGVLGAVVVVSGVNAVNFMDGVDGISSLFATVTGLGFVALGVVSDIASVAVLGALIAGLFAGFLPWNLLRRGTFLGDAGSYLLGGLVTGAAVLAVAEGIPPLAPAGAFVVYFADTAYTLVRRIREGKRWSESHREHLYQRLGFERIGHLPAALLVVGSTAICVVAGVLTLAPIGLPPAVALVVYILVAMAYLGLSLRLLRPARAS